MKDKQKSVKQQCVIKLFPTDGAQGPRWGVAAAEEEGAGQAQNRNSLISHVKGCFDFTLKARGTHSKAGVKRSYLYFRRATKAFGSIRGRGEWCGGQDRNKRGH